MPKNAFEFGILVASLLVSLQTGLLAAETPNSTNRTAGAEKRRESNGELDASQTVSTAKPRLYLGTIPQTIHGGIKIPAMILEAEANKFSFLAPAGWLTQVEPSQKRVHLVHTASSSLLTIKVSEGLADRALSMDKEEMQKRIMIQFPSGKILEEFSASALGQAGVGFELEWRSPSGSPQKTRTVFVPFSGGLLDFTLTASPDRMNQMKHDLNRLLLSFRSAPLNGKLELQPVTPE